MLTKALGWWNYKFHTFPRRQFCSTDESSVTPASSTRKMLPWFPEGGVSVNGRELSSICSLTSRSMNPQQRWCLSLLQEKWNLTPVCTGACALLRPSCGLTVPEVGPQESCKPEAWCPECWCFYCDDAHTARESRDGGAAVNGVWLKFNFKALLFSICFDKDLVIGFSFFFLVMRRRNREVGACLKDGTRDVQLHM